MKKQIKKNTLANKKDISILFIEGTSFQSYPFRIIWLENKVSEDIQFLIAVPKKKFKKAVDRNLIRRRLKEVFKQKVLPIYLKEKSISIVITYIGDHLLDFNEAENKMIATFSKFNSKYFKDEQ